MFLSFSFMLAWPIPLMPLHLRSSIVLSILSVPSGPIIFSEVSFIKADWIFPIRRNSPSHYLSRRRGSIHYFSLLFNPFYSTSTILTSLIFTRYLDYYHSLLPTPQIHYLYPSYPPPILLSLFFLPSFIHPPPSPLYFLSSLSYPHYHFSISLHHIFSTITTLVSLFLNSSLRFCQNGGRRGFFPSFEHCD